MASLNRVFIIGNLGGDPELRYTANQTPVVTLNVATTDSRQTADGQRQETTEWHRIVVWSKQAENCAKYLSKGRSVFVEGRLQTRSWDDKTTGQKRYATEIVAQSVVFLGGAPGQQRDISPQQVGNYAYGNTNGAPDPTGFGDNMSNALGGGLSGGQAGASGMSGIGGPSTPDLDNIPF